MARVIPSNLLQLRYLGAAAYVCLALAASASAQEMDTRVIVPNCRAVRILPAVIVRTGTSMVPIA